jgi:hypothetical protein
MSTRFLLTALAALAAAAPEPAVTPAAPATTVMPIFLPVDPQSLVAAVVGAGSDMTSYTFTCAPNVNCDFAGRGGNLTVTDTSTYIMSVNGAAAGTPADNLHVACTSYNSASVVCSETQNSLVGAAISTLSVVFTQNNFVMIPLTVTAGVELLASASAAAAAATAVTPTLTATGGTATAGSASASASQTGAAGVKEVSWVGAGLAAAALML